MLLDLYFVDHYNACIAPDPFHAKFVASGENMNHQKKKRLEIIEVPRIIL